MKLKNEKVDNAFLYSWVGLGLFGGVEGGKRTRVKVKARAKGWSLRVWFFLVLVLVLILVCC